MMAFARRLEDGDLHDRNRVTALMVALEMDPVLRRAEQVLMEARYLDTS